MDKWRINGGLCSGMKGLLHRVPEPGSEQSWLGAAEAEPPMEAEYIDEI